MTAKIRRILLILATSSGVIAASTLPAHAGAILTNHCEPKLHPQPHTTKFPGEPT